MRLRLLFILNVSRDVVLVCRQGCQTAKCYHIRRAREARSTQPRQFKTN
jgi:hypothetical protein